MSAPEPCLNAYGRCFSPIACTGWGYCRERNLTRGGTPDEATQNRWRSLAILRAAESPAAKETQDAG